MRSLIRILTLTRSLWPMYLGIALCSVGMSVTALVVPFLIGHATDAVVAGVRTGPSVTAVLPTVVTMALGVLAAELANTAFTNIGGYLGDTMTARLRRVLSTRYYEKLLALPQRYYDHELSGTIIGRLSRSISEVTDFVKSMSNTFFSLLLTTVAVLVITAVYSWPLAVLLAVMTPVYVWLTTRTSSRWQAAEQAKNDALDLANGRFSEVIGQIRVVRSFSRERAERDGFDRHYARMVDLTRGQARHWHGMDTLRRVVLNVAFFAMYLVIFVQTARGDYSVGVMVLLIQLMSMARQPILLMSFIIDSAQHAVAGSRSYFEVMDEPVERREPPAVTAGPDPAGSAPAGSPALSFADVDFSYEPGRPVLRGITFTVGRGERVALVGESGGGKSTLVNLLLGLYPADAGRILVLGRDSAALDPAELRAQIGVVFQDPSLFSGTIAENIAYGRPDADPEEIREAARRANADRFVSGFPAGYDTVIGERGMRLSGGQKQRIAVARAILKNAPVLVLDEATSSLDTRAERLVQAGLDELMADRTTLIIAHRLSTISSVDRIVTLRTGRVDEIGSPETLARSGGIYAQLLALQASSNRADRARLRAYDITTGEPDDADAVSHDNGDNPMS